MRNLIAFIGPLGSIQSVRRLIAIVAGMIYVLAILSGDKELLNLFDQLRDIQSAFLI
jgi:hypothetical protein